MALALTLVLVDDDSATITVDVTLLQKLDYFKRLLASGMQEASSQRVELWDVDMITVQRLLDYLMAPHPTKLMDVSFPELCRLHQLADRWCHRELTYQCARFLIGILDEPTLSDFIRYVSSGITDDFLIQALIKYLTFKAIDVMKPEVVAPLSATDWHVIQTLDLPAEVLIILTLAWHQHHPTVPLPQLGPVLSKVKTFKLRPIVTYLLLNPSNDPNFNSLIRSTLLRLIDLIPSEPVPPKRRHRSQHTIDFELDLIP
jgi:hypothetical protein